MTEVEVTKSIAQNPTPITFKAGKFAIQADGAVVGQMGETMVLVTVCANKTVKEGTDFFPLTVDIEERMYAAGKIPGSFFRREGRASDQAILTSRLIDRPIRPCFPEGFRNEVHIVGTILGADQENPHDVLAINCASLALMISGVPFSGPIGAIRLAFDSNGQWIVNPSFAQRDVSSFEIVVAGRMTQDKSDLSIVMVEAGATEVAFKNFDNGAPKPTEEIVSAGLELAKGPIKELIDLQLELLEKSEQKEPFNYELYEPYSNEVFNAVSQAYLAEVEDILNTQSKSERSDKIEALNLKALNELSERFVDKEYQIQNALKELIKKRVRSHIVNKNQRIDGRSSTEIRPLYAEVGTVSAAHGSGFFQRGETQVLSVATLGMPRMNQLLDSITGDETKHYMHHYNFPPFSTGEAGAIRGPRRREIGHGLLAERALVSVVPDQETFPYAIRVVSEVLSSNGSTSMASVCGSTLALMDAGVPIKEPVAGIAMGLIYEDGKYITLTDILGDEDHYGDMDFKVAGTKDVITALQLDTKIDGIPAEVLASALNQAKEARLKILEVIKAAISAPRQTLSKKAPRIEVIEIPPDKIGELIGPKGKTINALQQEFQAEITIENIGQNATVTIAAKDQDSLDVIKTRIDELVNPKPPKVGEEFLGTVVGITKYGAFVNIAPGKDGLLHISKISSPKKVLRVEEVLKVGDSVKVKVDDIDENGKISLGMVQDPVATKLGDVEIVSFEEHFEKELTKDLGDLGNQN